MKRHLAILVAILLSAVWSSAALAAENEEDTDTRLVDAKVVEVNDHRISVIARTGVEHVIAIDSADTRVTVKGRRVSLKNLRQGDIVTVELDELNPLKFARHITLAGPARTDVASTP